MICVGIISVPFVQSVFVLRGTFRGRCVVFTQLVVQSGLEMLRLLNDKRAIASDGVARAPLRRTSVQSGPGSPTGSILPGSTQILASAYNPHVLERTHFASPHWANRASHDTARRVPAGECSTSRHILVNLAASPY